MPYLPLDVEATDLPVNEILLNVYWAGLIIESLTNLQSPYQWLGDDTQVEFCINQIEQCKDLLMGFDNLILPNIAFQAQKASNVTVTSGTPALLTFGTIQHNQGGYYNTGNSRFTPLQSGRYKVWINVIASGTGNRDFLLRKNGSTIASTQSGPSSGNQVTSHVLVTEVDMDGIDDYLEVFVARSGSNFDVLGGSGTWWGARLVAL